MFNFDSLNKSGKKTVRDSINCEDWSFRKLSEYVGKEILVNGFFFTEGKYGKQVVVVAEDAKVNIPKRYTPDFEAIYNNDEALAEVLAGHLKLTDIENINSKNGASVAFKFASV